MPTNRNVQIAERLAWARKAADFKTAKEFADTHGIPQPTYALHETAGRGLTRNVAVRYAGWLGVSVQWLLTGTAPPDSNVLLVGRVGAGAEVVFVDGYELGGGEEIDRPPGAPVQTIAVTVEGNSMYPAYRDRDILYYSRHESSAKDCLGKECIVRLVDGRTLVKILQKGTEPQRYTLASHNFPPLENQKVVWIARIDWVKRAG